MPEPVTPESIAEAASQPAESSNGNQSAKAHPLKDQIEAAKFAAANTPTASGRKPRGFRFTRVIPPGSA